MNNYPDKELPEDEVDNVIKHFGKPLDKDYHDSLMEKLEAQRERFVFEKQQEQKQEQQEKSQDSERGLN